jgi:prepilin-type N-terminal cleavage/methylation domain-containing protein
MYKLRLSFLQLLFFSPLAGCTTLCTKHLTSKTDLSSKTGLSLNAGFTLIECLISLIIGILLSSVALNLYVKSNEFSRHNKSYQLVNNNGSTALTLIGGYIRDAGFSDINDSVIDMVVMAPPGDCDAVATEDHCSINNTNTSDVLALKTISNEQRGCNGATTQPNEIIVNVFRVDESRRELLCATYSYASPQGWLPSGVKQERVLQNGIQSMQIGYLLDDGTTTSDPLAASTQVLGISVSVLAISDAGKTLSNGTRTYQLLDATPITTNDGLLRKIYQSSFLINNLYAKSNRLTQ